MSDPVAALVRYVAQQAKAAGFCPLCNGQQTDGRTVAHARECPVAVAPQHVEGLARALVRAGDEFDQVQLMMCSLIEYAAIASTLSTLNDPRSNEAQNQLALQMDAAEALLDRLVPKNSKPPVG